MSGNRIDFNSDWTWTGKGKLPEKLRNSVTIQQKFSATAAELKETGNLFLKLKSNDNKLIGQERYLLVDKLEDLLGCFFCLYKTIMKAEDTFYSQFTERREQFNVELKNPIWKARGNLKANPASGAFEEWFNTNLVPQTLSFVRTYGEVLSDGILDYDEKEKLLTCLNRLIIEILKTVKGIKTGVLH